MASVISALTSGGGGISMTGDASGILNLNSNGTNVVAVTSAGATVTGSLNTPNTFGFKNRIINGGMVIDQRNAGASVSMTTPVYPVDRWLAFEDTDGTMTAQQSSTAPSGFTNSILITTTSADTSLGATQYARTEQRVEGFNVSDLAWGTASAASVTLSFWVRSSLTGTFGGSLTNSAFNRSYPFTYTISVANTFEQKTITIAGDTSGTWLTTNGNGMEINFGLGVGSTYSGTAGAWAGAGYISATGATSVVGTNGATFYITGVQLEKGSTATSFDFRDYGRELAMCQRYYYRVTTGDYQISHWYSTTTSLSNLTFPVTMRTAPAALEQNGTAADYSVLSAGSAYAANAVPTFERASSWFAQTRITVASGLTAGYSGFNRASGSTAYFGWSAEL